MKYLQPTSDYDEEALHATKKHTGGDIFSGKIDTWNNAMAYPMQGAQHRKENVHPPMVRFFPSRLNSLSFFPGAY